MDDILQPLFDKFVGWGRIGAPGAVALDGPRMPHTTLPGFFVAHASSLAENVPVATRSSDIR
jgi:hypothetical protein